MLDHLLGGRGGLAGQFLDLVGDDRETPAEFPGDFSWGYNPSFPFAPETAYGTPEDMKAFIDAAHDRGIMVVLDVVHNHWGPNDLPMWCFTGDCLGAAQQVCEIAFYLGAATALRWSNG